MPNFKEIEKYLKDSAKGAIKEMKEGQEKAMRGDTSGGLANPLGMALTGMTASPRPYSKASDSLMGFAKDKMRQKGFEEFKYKISVPVKIKMPDGEVFFDEINGLNRAHAIERAKRNWDGSEIIPIGEDIIKKTIEKLSK